MVVYDDEESRKTERLYLTPDVVRQRMRTLEALAFGAGERALDVGCGPGLLVHDMAVLVGPAGQAVGVDTSADMLALARQRCADLPNVRLEEGKAEELPGATESFDAVACTQVLLYVADVAGALAEMRRILKPGGRMAVIETDWRGVVLNSADGALTRRILAAWDDAVTSPNLPARLAPLLREQGFASPRVEAIPILNTSDAPGNLSPAMLRQFADYARQRGAIDEDEATAWLADLHARGEEGAYFFCVNRFLFSAVRL